MDSVVGSITDVVFVVNLVMVHLIAESSNRTQKATIISTLKETIRKVTTRKEMLEKQTGCTTQLIRRIGPSKRRNNINIVFIFI